MRRDDPPYRLANEEVWALVTGNALRIGDPALLRGFFGNRRWVVGGRYRIHADMLCVDAYRLCFGVLSDHTATAVAAGQTADPAAPRLPCRAVEHGGLRALRSPPW